MDGVSTLQGTVPKQSSNQIKADKYQKDVNKFKKNVPSRTEHNFDWLNWLSHLGYLLRLMPTWMWLALFALSALSAAAFLSSTLGVYFCGTQAPLRPLFTSGAQAAGASCSSTADCVTNAYCVKLGGSVVGTCQCATNYYYNGAICTLAFGNGVAGCGVSNSMCQTSYGLTCIAGTCSCDPNTYFYNTTSNRCQRLKVSVFKHAYKM